MPTHYPSDPHQKVYVEARPDGRLDICSCHDDTRMVVCEGITEVMAFLEAHDLIQVEKPKRRKKPKQYPPKL